MRRLAYHIAVALLTFTIGVFAASLWINWGLRGATWNSLLPIKSTGVEAPVADQRSRDEKCEEWEEAEPAGQGLGWDLTYKPALKRSGLNPESMFWGWAAHKPQPPVDKLAAEWQGDQVISAILVEVPPVCADGGGGWWVVRTKAHAYYWYFSDGKFDPKNKRLISEQEYDKAFGAMACWRQDEPSNRDMFDGREGYYGFLSLYQEGKSRQMLLTFKDFFISEPKVDKNYKIDEATLGRLWKTLKPLSLQ